MDKLTPYLLEVGLSSGVLYLGYLLIQKTLQPSIRRNGIASMPPISSSTVSNELSGKYSCQVDPYSA